jgi:uncharacterized protein (TIGR03435 family)
MKRLLLIALFGITIAVPRLFPQSTETKPSFDVVSIKPSGSLNRIVIQPAGPGRFLAEGIRAKMLIAQAYRVDQSRILGGPSWIDTDPWDVEGKAENRATTQPQTQLMLQSMLEDRFQLKMHRETREMPAYDLVVARGGPKLKRSEDQTPVVFGPPERGAAPPAGARGEPFARGALPRGAMTTGRGSWQGASVTVANIAGSLTRMLGQTVTDKTGISGLYDISLQFTPGSEQAPGPFGPPPPGLEPTVDPNAPSLFTALQEQLGLRLESTKGPAEVIVIDSVQKPTSN